MNKLFFAVIFLSAITSCNQAEIDELNSELYWAENEIDELKNQISELEQQLQESQSERNYYYRSWQVSEQNYQEYRFGNGTCMEMYYPKLGRRDRICGADNIIDALR